MAYRTLELTLISAKDLKEINLIGKMDVYVEASLSGDPRSRQRTKTHVDGGKYPSWNSTLRFTVPADPGAPGTLNLVLRAEKTLGDKDVGEVHIPLKELLANVRGDGPTQIQFLSYQVRTPGSGKQRGIINLSYKLSERIAAHTAAPAGYPPVTKSDKSETPATTYPPSYPPANSYPPAATYPPAAAYPPPATAYPPPATAYPPAYAPANSYPPPPPSEKPSKSSEKPSKSSEPVMAYPAGSSSAPAYPPQYGYPPAQQGYGYPPAQQGYGYPPQQGYGYPPQQGYSYPPQQAVKPQKNKNKFGMGLGAGLIGGALGGLILGDVVDDVYDSGYDAGFDDGGFDF